MQLFELVSPRLFRPLAGPNRAFYAELLLLLWEECRHTADYSILRAEAVSRAEDYFAALAKPLALDADDAGDEAEQPTRDPHTLALGFLLRLRRTGWLEEQPGSYEGEASLAFVPEVTPLLEALDWDGDKAWRKRLMAAVRTQAAFYPHFLEPSLAPGEELTPTELQILHLLCADKSNAEIAQIMDVKLPTVKTHVSHILDKLDVKRRAEAKTAAKKLRLIPDDL